MTSQTTPPMTLDDISDATDSALPTDPLATPTPAAPSASLYQQAVIRKLVKRTYRSGENVRVVVENAPLTPFSVTVTDSTGAAVRVPVSVRPQGSTLVFDLVPPADFRPGKYRVSVTDGRGNTSTQEFSWGVLAINPDRSRYTPGQTAMIAIAVLDEQGFVVCDADVTLSVVTPGGSVVTRKTADGSVAVTGACTTKEVTETPDYETSFPITESGEYVMTLTAVTDNGTETVTDSVTADVSLPFAIRRQAPTRIYPPNSYPVILSVTAAADFHGEIVETVPESFAVTQADGTVPYTAVRVDTLGDQGQTVDIVKPFTGDYPVTLGFGDEIADPAELAIYRSFGLAGHDGVDFAVPMDTPVRAADDGTVILAKDSSYGLTVIIKHDWGETYYGHLSETLVAPGDTVTKGQQIALSGNSGISTGPHLHFGLKLSRNNTRNGYYGKTDPLPYLTGVARTSARTVKRIVWDVSLKAGETVRLGYRFRAPSISPWLFLIGPLRFVAAEQPPASAVSPDASAAAALSPEASASAGFVLGAEIPAPDAPTVYDEGRQWQIASDAVALAQTPVTNGGKAVTTLSATITAATANNLIVVVCSSSLAETLGVSTTGFSSAINESGAAPSQAIYYKVSTGGETSVTCTYGTGTGNRAGIQVFEYSGLRTTGVLDVAAGASTGSSVNPAAPAVVTTNNEDLVMGSVTIISNTSFSTWTNSFTEEADTTDGQTPASSRITFGTADYSTMTTGSYSTVATAATSGSWRGQTVAFKQILSAATTDRQMRHGSWFSGGVEQGFTF